MVEIDKAKHHLKNGINFLEQANKYHRIKKIMNF